MADERKLHSKIAEVMLAAQRIPKRGKAPKEMGGYEFVQVGDAADFIREALGQRRVTMLPTSIEIVDKYEHQTRSGASMTTLEVKHTWTLTDGETGETAVIESFGAGADTGDKYSGKAQTNSMKYALLAGFLLSTGDDPEVSTTPERIPAPTQTHDGGLVGIVEKGTATDSDLGLRQTPEGWHIGFRLKANGRGGIKVVAKDALAEAIAPWASNLIGQRVTCWGRIADETFTPKGSKAKVTYQVMQLERLQTPDFTLPTDVAPGQETLPLDPEERAIIAGDLAE